LSFNGPAVPARLGGGAGPRSSAVVSGRMCTRCRGFSFTPSGDPRAETFPLHASGALGGRAAPHIVGGRPPESGPGPCAVRSHLGCGSQPARGTVSGEGARPPACPVRAPERTGQAGGPACFAFPGRTLPAWKGPRLQSPHRSGTPVRSQGPPQGRGALSAKLRPPPPAGGPPL